MEGPRLTWEAFIDCVLDTSEELSSPPERLHLSLIGPVRKRFPFVADSF